MPLVNLIAVHRSQRRVAIAKTRAVMGIWVIELVVCVLITGGLMWQGDKKEEHLGDLRQKMQSMAPYMKMVDEGNQQLAQIRPRLSTLQAAGQYSDRWVRILEHLGTQMPSGAWLTGIRIQEGKNDKDGDQVTFVGFASTQTTVGQVMMSLNDCADLSDVQLKFTKEKQTPDSNGVEYEVFAKLMTPKTSVSEREAKAAEEANNGRS